MTLPRGLMMKPTLKKRSLRSGWRALAWAMTNALYSLAIFPSSSVASPGIAIAHSRAKVAWSRSSTSSLNACSAPSGKAISLTGISRLESHDAAFTRCERCSRLILMSLRLRMPRTVGTRPTAVYGLIMRALLRLWRRLGRPGPGPATACGAHHAETSADGDARHFPDAVVVQLDRHLVLSGAVAVGAAIDHRAPPRRRHTLALLVGPPEPRDDVVVARAGRNQGADGVARGPGAVPRTGGGRQPPAGAEPPADPAAHVLAQDQHAREVRDQDQDDGDDDRPPVEAAAEVLELDTQALRGDVFRGQQGQRHDLATGAHAALPPARGGRRDLLELEVVGVAEVGDDQRVLAGQVDDPVAALVVEREEPERGRPQVAEARREDVAPAPEEFVDPGRRLGHDEPADRHGESDERERIDEPRRPRDLDECDGAGLTPGPCDADVGRGHVDGVAERGGADLHSIAGSQHPPTAAGHREAAALDVAHELGFSRAGRGALGDLGGPEEIEVLGHVRRALPRPG